ncbi:MAG: hypothetical protein JWM44_2845 [Bacilli bacterium]|nr:hypothetical protein [Bacilli bacterium]
MVVMEGGIFSATLPCQQPDIPRKYKITEKIRKKAPKAINGPNGMTCSRVPIRIDMSDIPIKLTTKLAKKIESKVSLTPNIKPINTYNLMSPPPIPSFFNSTSNNKIGYLKDYEAG